MFKGALTFLSILWIAAAFAHPGLTADKIMLGLRPAQGKSYERRITYNQRISLGRGEYIEAIDRSITMEISSKVSKVDEEGSVFVSNTCNSLIFKQTGATGILEYDSDHPSEKVPDPVRDLAPLIGRSFLMKISPDGRIRAIEGIGNGSVESLMTVFPQRPVDIGDAWSSRVHLFEGLPIYLDSVFTLQKRNGNLLLMNVKSTVQKERNRSSAAASSLMIGCDVDGTIEGTLELEESSGWPVRADVKHVFSGRLDLEEAIDLPVEIALPFSGEGSVILEPM